MNEHPILFSTTMVKAILKYQKTMTRRILKVKGCKPFIPDDGFDKETIEKWNKDYFPFGKIGDLLWVKETFYAYGHWTTFTENGKSTKKFMDLTRDSYYLHQFHADWQPNHQAKFGELGWHKRSALFMPKVIAKRWLKITDISVERLQDISDDDARAEGIKRKGNLYYFYPCKDLRDDTYIENGEKVSFYSLWKSINGKESWDANPWVWVITFEVLSTTGRPRICKVCGCTDDNCEQCIEKTGEPCEWVEEDLCSACLATKEGDI